MGRGRHCGSTVMVQCCAVTELGCRVSSDGGSMVVGVWATRPGHSGALQWLMSKDGIVVGQIVVFFLLLFIYFVLVGSSH